MHTLPRRWKKWPNKKNLGYSKVIFVKVDTEAEGKWVSNNTWEAGTVLKWGSKEEGMSYGKVKMYFHSENDLIN